MSIFNRRMTAQTRAGFLTLAVIVAGIPAPAMADADLLSRVKAAGTLTVATEARYPPFEYVDNGQIVGYSADVVAEVMKALPGVKLERLDLPFQGILPGLSAKRFDYVVTSVTATKARAAAYHLSMPIADATMTILKRKGDASIKGPDDLPGKVGGSQAGSAQLLALNTVAETLKSQGKAVKDVRSYVDFDTAYADLGAGRLDAVVNSLPNLIYAQQERPDAFEVVMPTFGPKAYFAWVGRNDPDSESLNAFFDKQLQMLKANGKLAEIQKKWFGTTMDLPDVMPPPAS